VTGTKLNQKDRLSGKEMGERKKGPSFEVLGGNPRKKNDLVNRVAE